MGENAAVEKKHEPFEHTFSMTVKVDGFWVEYLTRFSDVFGRGYAGYWAYGAECDRELGWLVYEQSDDPRPNQTTVCAVERVWRAGKALPPRWYRLDRAAALRAWEEGIKRWGADWYEQTDSTREDVVIQLALLGEIRYG
jgi:hypothetical protein